MSFRRLTLLLCALATSPVLAEEPQDFPLDAQARARVLDNTLSLVRKHFYSQEKAAKVEQALRQRMKKGEYDGITSTRKLAEALDSHVKALKIDGHLSVFFTPRSVPLDRPLPWELSVEEKRKFDERTRRRDEANNFGIQRVQRLDGNVGYLHLNAFAMAELGAGEASVAAMKLLNATDALIVDLRGNAGGDPNTVAMYLGWLLPQQEVVGGFVTQARIADRTVTPGFLPAGRYGNDKEVYVLTDAKTISAGEQFPYNIQVFKRGKVVGEKTAGAANPTVGLAASEHVIVAVPMGQAVHPVTKTSWEGVGVTPDVAVKGEDAFHAAYEAALRKLAARTDDDQMAEEAREALAGLKPGSRP